MHTSSGTFSRYKLVPHLPVLGEMTADECLKEAQTGELPDWARLREGVFAPNYTSDFSVSSDGWTTDSPGTLRQITGNVDGIAGEDDWNKMEMLSTGQLYAYRTSTIVPADMAAVESYRIHNPAGSPFEHVSIRFTGISASTPADGITKKVFAVPPGTTVDIVTHMVNTGNLAGISLQAANPNGSAPNIAAGAPLYWKNVTVRQSGRLGRLLLDPNYGIRDLGVNGYHGVRTTNTTFLPGDLGKFDSAAAYKVSHSGSGPLQFAGGAAIDTSKNWAIDAFIVISTAAVTWSLGNASNGAQYVSGFSLQVGVNYVTGANLVTRLISGANLWSKNDTGAADITVIPVLRRA